jgi:catechol 2,3-dioxygenase-like lactoylglutathione lyase family enzyme
VTVICVDLLRSACCPIVDEALRLEWREFRRSVQNWPVPHMSLVTVLVDDYDEAIVYFTDVLGFELIEDSPSTTTDGRPKRWVVVRPADGQTGLLLAIAVDNDQRSAVGRQVGGRVGFFLHVEQFAATYERLRAAGVEFIEEPRVEPYGQVVVFVDIAGNRWDLIGPA